MHTSPAFRRLLAERTVEPSGCWVSESRSRMAFGYTRIWHNGKVSTAHRVAWDAANGPIPAGRFVLHHCDNPPCFNPDHLFLGTDADNKADMYSKGRGSCTDPTFRQKVKAAWTPEKRATHAARTRQRILDQRAEAARTAGQPEGWKSCSACGGWFPPDGYYREKRRADGRMDRCKSCVGEYQSEWRRRHSA